jgi:hypothetical protein
MSKPIMTDMAVMDSLLNLSTGKQFFNNWFLLLQTHTWF